MTGNDKKQRDYLFDNYKVLLIYLVVVGHFIESSTKGSPFLLELKWFLVSFHMPAFLFISGYFSKKQMPLRKIVQKLLVPYLVYELLYYLLYTVFLGKDTSLALLRPKFTLWFLLALFFYRLATPYVKKLPGYLLLSVAAGLLIGCTDLDNFLTIPRALVFYPFFLAGTLWKRDWLTRLRTPAVRLLAAAGLFAVVCFLFTDRWHHTLTVKIFYGRYSYEAMGQSIPEGMLIRLICYLISAVMILLLGILITERKTACSYLGNRTMPIYLFHGMLCASIKSMSTVLKGIHTGTEIFLLLCFCAVLLYVFSRKPFVAFTDQIAAITLPRRRSTRRLQSGMGMQI